MNIFITGASGFIGGAITKALAASHNVYGMSRSNQSDDHIRSLGATPVRCELGAVRPEHLADCEVVIHCAAFVKQCGTREEFWKTNVDGTAQLLEVARLAGVRRFIHVGTEAALFHGQHMRDMDETYPYPDSTPFLYPETKAAAEKLVLSANAPGFETISLRPRFVWGPGDQTILPVVKKMVNKGMYMWIDQGRVRTSTTHIDNFVHAVTLALTRGRGGEAYFITDDSTSTVREFLTALLKTQAITMPNTSIPSWLARALGWSIEGIWKLLRLKSEPPLTHFAAAMASSECTIRIDKARAELGYAPVMTIDQGLAELANP
ncbi:MAG TPA: NAD-dependent epimerase/dehydratase family protein [Anaerolineales bacterium]|nr:NAD-dependent epimerase/dehydratase family protein [Anaerolineales bacterium]